MPTTHHPPVYDILSTLQGQLECSVSNCKSLRLERGLSGDLFCWGPMSWTSSPTTLNVLAMQVMGGFTNFESELFPKINIPIILAIMDSIIACKLVVKTQLRQRQQENRLLFEIPSTVPWYGMYFFFPGPSPYFSINLTIFKVNLSCKDLFIPI